jgi:hypothetical protein
MLNSLCRWSSTRGRRPASRRCPLRTRLNLEPLEDRVVPAATVLNVNSTADVLAPTGGTVTLRSAIQAANTTPNPDGTVINLTTPGTYQITLPGTPGETDNAAGEFAIKATGGNLTIKNTSGGKVTIDGGGHNRVFDINPANTNDPATKMLVTIQGVTIQDGNATSAANPDGPDASGGGIRDQGNVSLALHDVVLTNNSASADGGGVSMENTASTPWTLTIDQGSIVSNNHAGDAGGGVETDGSGKVFVTDSTIIGNTSVNQGAGIWLDAVQADDVFQGANLTVTNTFIAGNSALAANNFGGGIGNAGNGAVTITGSTLADNTVNGTGGGFGDENNVGSLTVVDSTFVGNSAVGPGGGIAEGGTLTINDSTITGNTTLASGGGISAGTAAFVLNNTIVAGNFANGTGGMNFLGVAPDVFGAVTSGSGDFIGIGDGNLTGVTNGSNGNRVGATDAPLNPLLGPLQLNGGRTPTEVPLAGSPVIDAGVNGVIPAGLTTDQRGLPRIVNKVVDVGAAEVQPAPAPVTPDTTGTADTTVTVTGVTDSYTFKGQKETVTVRVVDANGNPVNGGQVTITDNGVSKTVGVSGGSASATFTFGLFHENPNAHGIDAVFSGAGFNGSRASTLSPSTLMDYLFQLALDDVLLRGTQH